MKCAECGTRQPDGAVTCDACGASQVRVCPACKRESPALYRYCGRCGARFDDAPRTHDLPATISAERRVVSIMFVDLVGSTALSTAVDPEDLRDILQAYRQAAARVIRSLGGHVAKLIGDGLLVLFGYPIAHEDAAERAVWAGLKVIGAVGRVHHPKAPNLQVRVGIATGLVVVGRLEAEGAAEEDSVIGETPNLAARIQGEAGPDTVLISDETRQSIGDLFELTDLGTRNFKGITTPTRLWSVGGRREAESRFDAVRAKAKAPLIGREHELFELLKRWRMAAGGAGQAMTVIGEAGIGKSRLAKALSEAIAKEPHTRIRLQCSPFHINSPLHPVQLYLARTAGITDADSPEVKRGRLEAVLGQVDPETMALFAGLMLLPKAPQDPDLAIGASGRASAPYAPNPDLQLTPAQRKERTLDAVATRLLALAKHNPLLLTLEDGHWIDPTTQELIQIVIERAKAASVLVVITGRPEIAASWKRGSLPEGLTLDRLKKSSCEKLVRAMPGAGGLPDDVIDGIVERTDGMPLFVEVLTEAVLESGPASSIPASLQDSLMARIDRLGVGKEIAQIASCIGRSFTRELLAAAGPGLDLKRGLIVLEEAGLIHQVGTADAPRFAFKHALVRDTAYESLLKKRREDVHASIARAIEDTFPEQAETEPELVAQHYTLARIPAPAVDYWHSAGRRSSERSANAEAISQLQMALDLLKALPGTPERDRRELRLCIDIAVPLNATRGYGAPELEQVINRALVLCRRIEITAEVFPVLYGRFAFQAVTGRIRRALELAEECVSLADLQPEPEPRMVALRMLGTVHCLLGQPEVARAHLTRALASYEPARHRSMMFAYSQDIRIAALAYLALSLVQTRQMPAALERAREAAEGARTLDHANTLGYGLTHVALVRALGGDVEGARECARELIALAKEQEMRLWAACGKFFDGWVQSQERAAAGIDQMGGAADAIAGAGVKLFRPMFLGWKAEALARAKRVEEAEKTLAEARAVMEETGEKWVAAELSSIEDAVKASRGEHA